MHLVAIGEIHGTLEDAIRPLADDLGTTPYELRLLLNAGLPAVVLATVDETRARAAFDAVRRLGHLPIRCERSDVVSSASMTPLREFRLAEDALVADVGSGDRLAYQDIAVMLRAMHRTTTVAVEQVKERKIRPVMAIATGGLVLSKTTKREVTTRTEAREQVLYIFPHSSSAPWLLRERAARYGGLGAELRPTSLDNFALTTQRLRQRAPEAAYDERLMTSRPIRGVADGIEASDILAHLLAIHLRARP